MDNTGDMVEVVGQIASASFSTLAHILIMIGLSALTALIAKIVNTVVRRLLRKASMKEPGKLTPLMAGFIGKVVGVIVWLFAILIILQIWGINLAPVIAGLGITGVVLGFALQESISNVFSGLLLALNNPFALGDYVIIGSVEGTVEAMDGISITLRTGDQKKITMANKLVLEEAITNVSASPTRRLDMSVGVAYGSDLDKTRRVILSLLESYPEVLSDPAPTVEVSKLSASSVDFIVRPWVANGDYWAVNWRFQREVYGALDREGISIPFNRLDVSLVKS